ncbi:autotransporter outer membrane beta-barrel domain-containing protein [Sulfuritalea hydrogenivorans]|uniref:autotransporter outer membrane beta-barrel domain-containing protein n=1 Tax=Sulfuritalea hydrogenivorans TaxID=748811 RepID=UPI0009FE4C9A|nr:autotransporter outer membrane beta-barrel domain-containing protein [Sulfuritalea hydrogenivorans]
MIKQLRYVLATGMAAGFFGASGMANATTCPSAIASFNACAGSASCEALITGSHPECFGSSANTAAGAKSIQATSLEQMLAISSNVSNRGATLTAPPGVVSDSGERKGLAAGNPAGKWNVWASVAEADAKYDRGTYNFNGADRTNKFDNRIDNFVLGGDYQYAPNLAIGLSLAFDHGRGSAASYTLAAPDASKSVSTSGYTYAPYLGWQINKDWALDATIGWGNGKSTVDSTVKTDTKRFFYGTNIGYTRWSGNWQLTGKGSYLFGQEKGADTTNNGATLANTKVTNEVGQFRIAGQAAYWMNGVMPYFGLAYVADDRSSTATAAQQDATAMGKSAFVWSLGANFISIKNAMTGGIGYEQETGRSRAKNNKLMANINVRF